jgi:hypothetical protein
MRVARRGVNKRGGAARGLARAWWWPGAGLRSCDRDAGRLRCHRALILREGRGHIYFLMRIKAKFGTVPLCKRKLFIIRSYQILVLTIVLSHLRHADAKNSVKNYQVSTTYCENAIRKYLNWLLYLF